MTAEIAIYNKSAVALAADSAVTIQGGGTHKIYNGAEKLFALSKKHPVGVMVYGAGSLCRVPWELIIKQYRAKKLQNRSFSTLEAYAEDFWDYLLNSGNLIPSELRENNLDDGLKEFFYNGVIRHIEDHELEKFITREGQAPNIRETYDLMERRCEDLLGILPKFDFYQNFNDDDLVALNGFAEEKATTFLQKLPSYEQEVPPESLISKLSSLLSGVICRDVDFGQNTGVVFAGYGDDEYFPVVLSFNVLGFANNKIRFKANKNKSAAGGVSGLCAYAQEDEVDVFLSGISRGIRSAIDEDHKNALQSVLDACSDALDNIEDEDQRKELKNRIIEQSLRAWDESSKNIQNHIQNCYIDKVVGMIEFLPKQELAEMAESMVNLTAFKRKVSNESETVGGPIDVAIISKGDGFIWVQRKHYFTKELNDHYFVNQSSGVTQNE
ncbi:hypothetical protein [Vibrio litoralis]|uniref:hypothetical protein n=1 Tax=Vibrio litoralis TaxID=335972 RepID=UPI0004204FBA|nr:hypothetical protein [Vibrio litoralis]